MKKPRTSTGRRSASNDNVAPTAARALWKGTLGFGLVQIPVSLVPAERPNELAFHQLDRHDQSPIGYERINKKTGAKVAWGDIVKGYEVSKGHFVVLDDEDFEKANVKASQSIEIQDFVDVSAIPPAYYERPYHLLPEGRSDKAYAVLTEAMAKKRLAAIALVVLRTRQHLCAVLPSPRGGGLDLELLRFAHELREAPRAETAPGKPTSKEVALAEQLIDGMVGEWDPARYRDQYRDDLLAAIDEKAKTGTIEAKNLPEVHAATTTDLLALLKKSVAAAKSPRGGQKKARPASKKPAKHAAA
jgi:DNA end-binding protein Ku